MFFVSVSIECKSQSDVCDEIERFLFVDGLQAGTVVEVMADSGFCI